jgi:hypothetical protein
MRPLQHVGRGRHTRPRGDEPADPLRRAQRARVPARHKPGGPGGVGFPCRRTTSRREAPGPRRCGTATRHGLLDISFAPSAFPSEASSQPTQRPGLLPLSSGMSDRCGAEPPEPPFWSRQPDRAPARFPAGAKRSSARRACARQCLAPRGSRSCRARPRCLPEKQREPRVSRGVHQRVAALRPALTCADPLSLHLQGNVAAAWILEGDEHASGAPRPADVLTASEASALLDRATLPQNEPASWAIAPTKSSSTAGLRASAGASTPTARPSRGDQAARRSTTTRPEPSA